MFMAGGVMSGTLKSQELMDGRDDRGVGGSDPHLSSARTIGGLVGDLSAASHQDGCTWHHLVVHPERLGKVSGSKRCRDVSHVFSDGGDPGDVRGTVGVKDDPPTIFKVLKNVRRSVLIHAHDGATAGLHCDECTVRLEAGGLAPAPAPAPAGVERKWNHEGQGRSLRAAAHCLRRPSAPCA